MRLVRRRPRSCGSIRNYTIDGTQRRMSLFKRPEDAEHLFDALRKAGLPER